MLDKEKDMENFVDFLKKVLTMPDEEYDIWFRNWSDSMVGKGVKNK